jgi:NAD(P)-dependent dehydrogenase (short-subunit alcohol dehydrogenase family)
MERDAIDRVPWGAVALASTVAGLWLMARARRRRRYAVRDKVVVITGGSRGLGLELAREFGRAGGRIAVAARDPAGVRMAVEDLRERGVTAMGVPCDVTTPAGVSELVSSVRTAFGPIDVLINNAGTIEVGPLEHMSDRDHRDAFEIHVMAPMRLIEAVAPDMIRRRRGQIVNITSIGGEVPVPHMLPYTATKHALVGLSRGYRLELGRHGIKVTTVVPGLVRTGSPRNATFKGRHHAEYTWFTMAESAPLLSSSARSVARSILRAVQRGDTDLYVGGLAKIGTTFQAIWPRFTGSLLAGANQLLLPRPARHAGARGWAGHESTTMVTRSPLMILNHRAERRQLERRTET